MTSSSESKKVLIVALSGIGNFLMQSPTIDALKKAHPNWKITVWLAPRGVRALAKSRSSIDEVLEESPRRTSLNHLRLAWRLRRQHFDIGLVLSPGQLIKSAAYLYLAGIPTRIGHTYPLFGRRTGFLLTKTIAEDPALHDLEQNMRLLSLLNNSPQTAVLPAKPEDNLYYSLPIPLKSQKHAEELIAKLNIPTSKRLVGLHPGSAPNFLWKRWPLKRFSELAQRLIARNHHILIFGGPDEARLKNKLKQWLGNDATIIDADLLTCAELMRRCHIFISNDSGLMHVAAAAGAPTLGIFGPTDERQTGPRGKHSLAVRAPETQPVYHTEHNFNLGTSSHFTLKSLPVAQVLSAVDKLI